MASGGNDQNAEYALSKLLQMGTVAEYESKFVKLANRVTGISANLLKSFYIFRLKLELQRELFRLRPTTLGEAFSFARIAEARFEDERSTIAIAKPNELTAHVHVQDLEQTNQGKEDKPNRILPKTPAKEVVDNANGSALICLVGYDTGSEVVIGLPEEFREGDMVDAVSRVLEQLIAVAEDETTHFLEPYYSPSSILVPVLLIIKEYGIPESISLQDNTLRARWL
ncbi:hypothetical protein Tco_1157894 [Tanacetum coccineum]